MMRAPILKSAIAGFSLMFFAPLAIAQDGTGAATEQTQALNIPAGPMADALDALVQQSGIQLIYRDADVAGITTGGVSGETTVDAALDVLLQGTELVVTRDATGAMAVGTPNAFADTGADAGPFAEGSASANVAAARRAGVEEIIVTGQKKEERLQDVPIAISAFSMEQLDAQKIEGGFDLLKAIPNVTFSKTNFSGYNFQIRGVGTQSISAASDPGVAVSFNNTPVIQNRLFEQEYLDVERVEVLRGPQGTLYGRNATAGVINVISHKPELQSWEAELDLEIGNYQTQRLRGLINVPIGDTFAARAAFAMTDREGYTFNAGTGRPVDGRDLWTGRLSLAWEPIDTLRFGFVWERFSEEDDRLRTGKQLCHRDDGPDAVGGVSLDGSAVSYTDEEAGLLRRAMFSQGCKPGSIYSESAYGTPNGLANNFILGILALKPLGSFTGSTIGFLPGCGTVNSAECNRTIIEVRDPYGGKMQSRDLRQISSTLDPVYRAEADLIQFDIDVDVSDELLFSSQTAYVDDETYSFQDFNRFKTDPVFVDTLKLQQSLNNSAPSAYQNLAPDGVFCDPQLGCSDTVAGFDIAQAAAQQFSQEFRLQSAFSGPLNFSVGANYTEFETLVDYYIMYNLITAMAQIGPLNNAVNGVFDPGVCAWSDYLRGVGNVKDGPVPLDDPRSACPYIDPNPIDFAQNFEGDGHNYFRSKNPYKLKSTGLFGELYWNIWDDLKLTTGIRYTRDEKELVNVPSQVLLAPSYLAGGTVAKGYPEDGIIRQKWGEWTGRLVLDWQPVLSFTDETLVYLSYSRGYKGGGANPPRPGFATREQIVAISEEQGIDEFWFGLLDDLGVFPVLELTADEYEPTFEPEFVNAFELGTKNTFLQGALSVNATAFYYNYADYQVSQIRDRTAVNENFDAEMWGLELETVFAPSPDWQLLANVGYLKTRIADGEQSIDIMNRTQGRDGYILAKPWAQLPSNCVIPTDVAARWATEQARSLFTYVNFCGVGGLLGAGTDPVLDPNFGNTPYDPANYPELNGGAGILADLGGNELPQSPQFTVTVGGQRSFDLGRAWRGTIRADYYWQDDSYHRIYNSEPYDVLESWSNVNLSMWVVNENEGLTIEAYVKNLFDEDPITGAFLNSDDAALTTNVFIFDPRLIGLSIKKEF